MGHQKNNHCTNSARTNRTYLQCSSDSNKMEILGYYHIDCGTPDQELVDWIKTAFYGGSTIEEGPTTHVKQERICEEDSRARFLS